MARSLELVSSETPPKTYWVSAISHSYDLGNVHRGNDFFSLHLLIPEGLECGHAGLGFRLMNVS